MSVRDISGLIKPQHLVDSENLTTLFVVVSKFAKQEWDAQYEKLTNFVVRSWGKRAQGKIMRCTLSGMTHIWRKVVFCIASGVTCIGLSTPKCKQSRGCMCRCPAHRAWCLRTMTTFWSMWCSSSVWWTNSSRQHAARVTRYICNTLPAFQQSHC